LSSKNQTILYKVTLEFVANGTTYKGLNYSNFIKLRESMQNDVENAKTVEDRLKAQQRLQEFSQNLEDAKKDAMIKAVSDVMNGSGKGLVNGQKLLNGADLEIINSAHRNINLDISSKSVAVTYDEEGNIEPGSRWDTEITDGRQLFGKLSTETEDVANLRDALTEQRGNISERSVATQSGDYLKYQANSRVVRGQGKSEKK